MTELDVIFEQFWNSGTVPAFFRTDKVKATARLAFDRLCVDLAQFAGRPNTIKTAIAVHKIGRMLQAAQVIAQDPEPDPEAVTAAVQQILERLQKEHPTT